MNMKEIEETLKKISSHDLLKGATELYQQALKTNNLKIRYQCFQEAKSLEKIAKELVKFETPTNGF